MPKARKGGEHERGLFPRMLGGLGGLPQVFFLILSASMCVFNVFFMRLGTDFCHHFLLENIFLDE